MEKEFIVTFPSSIQITEDSYKTVNPTLKVGSNTTVGEIEPSTANGIKVVEWK